MKRLAALLAVTAAFVVLFPATAPAPNEGGGGGGGTVCTWGVWVAYNQIVHPCGYNNWRSLQNSVAYTQGGCNSGVGVYGGNFDYRCGDYTNLFLSQGGSYSRPFLHNSGNPYSVYFTGYVSTAP